MLNTKRLLSFFCAVFLSAQAYGQIFSGSVPVTINSIRDAIYCNDTSGAANTITCNTTTTFTTYQDGDAVDVKLANSVTGATVIDINSLGSRDVTFNGSNAMDASTGLVAGGVYRFQYNSTGPQFELQGVVSAGSVAGSDTQIIFNQSGALSGEANLLWDYGSNRLEIIGNQTITDSLSNLLFDVNSNLNGNSHFFFSVNPGFVVANNASTLGNASGASVIFKSINAGDVTASGTKTGGSGGVISFDAGDGGGTTVATRSTGGVGGDITFSAGIGGVSAGSITATGGTGGNVASAAGFGGDASGVGDNVGGVGGSLLISAASGGAAAGGATNVGGNGGDVVLTPGLGGTGSTANGNDGHVRVSTFAGAGQLPVCADASGNLYLGTNTVGVLACP